MYGIQSVLGLISSSGKRKPVWGRGRKRGREEKGRRGEESGKGREGEGKEETKEREGKRKVREKLDKKSSGCKYTLHHHLKFAPKLTPAHQEHTVFAPYTCSLIIPLEVKIKTNCSIEFCNSSNPLTTILKHCLWKAQARKAANIHGGTNV